MMTINSTENILEGAWIIEGDTIKEDAICERIKFLTKNCLIKVAEDDTGWEILYIDPQDARYWELTYPNSEEHGGGAPCLTNITKEKAISKYAI